jgi:hypothetical protein
VAGEVEFFLGGEDAEADAFGAFLFERATLDEGGFGEVEFAGDGLHLLGCEGGGIHDDGERIAFERSFGEDVYDEIFKLHGIGSWRFRHSTIIGQTGWWAAGANSVATNPGRLNCYNQKGRKAPILNLFRARRKIDDSPPL